MQFSQESYRTRWLVLVIVWTLAAAALFMQARVVRDYLDIAGKLGSRNGTVPPTPLSQVYPVFAADALTWVRHAISLTEGNGPQLRFTTIDNAPNGREVHWNSAWAWAIVGAGKVNQLFTGQPLPNAIERATVWLNPFALLCLIIVISAWATQRAGLMAGIIVVVATVCTDRMFEGFFPTYVDHHGLLTISVFAMMLGALCMGGGWWQERTEHGLPLLPVSPEVARKSAIFSAISGACGLWVSAASVIPPIALVGLSGLLVVLLQGRTALRQGAQFDPGVWRLWGQVGAGFSLFFYLLEYFPTHLGMRLEANHPLHAIAWLGGGELIAQISDRWLGAKESRWANLRSLIWPVAVVLAGPLTLLIGGSKVFIVFDPFMSNLHNRYIQEFLPLWVTLRGFNAQLMFQIIAIDNLPLIAAIATLSYRRRESPLVLWFATAAAFLFNAMGWAQSRWLLNASGVQICLAMTVVAVWTISLRPAARWLSALALVGVFYLPTGILRYTSSAKDVEARRVSPKDATAAIYRDIAAAIRATQPTGEIVLLTSPNASTAIGYYGRFKTLGTLYWENSEGLKAAASIFGARSEEEAAKLIIKNKVTHIAIIAEENFIAPYYELLHPNPTAEEVKKCFGLRLFADKVVPQWLQMIPYKMPDDVKSISQSVMLFKVNFAQTLPEALYNVALTQVALDTLADAEKTFDLLIAQYPQFYQPWLRKGEVLLRRHNWIPAAEHMLKGISLAPAAERPALFTSAGGMFYGQQQHGLAVEIYRRALADQPNPDAACYLAWVLATSPIDALRNGAEALRFAEEALKADPNSPTYLNSLAAALAENGRFPEAMVAVDRALANAQVQGARDAFQSSEQNIEVLRTGKPIRR